MCGDGPSYCQGCIAIGRDCGLACPDRANVPTNIEGATAWSAAMACCTSRDGLLSVDVPAAVTLARTLDNTLPAWAALALITAIAEGVADAAAKRTRND
jgi:hypothetical protein